MEYGVVDMVKRLALTSQIEDEKENKAWEEGTELVDILPLSPQKHPNVDEIELRVSTSSG